MWIFLFFNWIFFWYVMSSKVLKSILFTWTYQTRDTITSKKNLFVEKCFLFFFWNFLKFFWKVFEIIFANFAANFFCTKKIEIFEKIKKKSNFLKFHQILVFFCENFDFRKTSWWLLSMKKMQCRAENVWKNRRN